MNWLSCLGVIGALCLMAVLIFKQISPMLAGPIAIIVVCLTSGLPLLEAFTDTYLHGIADFFISLFPVFLLGNIFGSIYEMSGAAKKISQIISKIFGTGKVLNCMTACLFCAAVMSFGGINSFVIIFAVYPIALRLFEEADIPQYLLPGIVCGGMWTFAMTGPFTPQIPNILSMENLGTPSYAGLIPGTAASVAMAVMIVAYMTHEAEKCKKKGMKFVKDTSDEKSKQKEIAENGKEKLPSGIAGFLPLILVIGGFNLTEWGILIWLVIGIFTAVLLQISCLDKRKMIKRFNQAATDAVIVNMNTAAVVGFGSVTSMTLFYNDLIGYLSSTHANPYITAVVASNLCACVLGSSSGGMALMYTSLKDTFLSAAALGYRMEYIHRLCALGGGCLDTMPWNGSIISVFSICKTTHRQSYKYNLITCGIIPMICTVFIALPLCVFLR